MAALDIKNTLTSPRTIYLYTYGQPRVGDDDFSNYVFTQIPANYYRVTHYDDTVAHIPPLISGYKHAGHEVWYKSKDHDGYYLECHNFWNVGESKQCSNSLWLKTGVTAHLTYMGHNVSKQCSRN